MQTEEFAQGLATLLHVASACRAAMMCSELLWWRCHRALVSDALLASGWRVTHILGDAQDSGHRLSSPAQLVGGVLTYRAADCC
jgi:uncharacterized protein (DUF488 family)